MIGEPVLRNFLLLLIDDIIDFLIGVWVATRDATGDATVDVTGAATGAASLFFLPFGFSWLLLICSFVGRVADVHPGGHCCIVVGEGFRIVFAKLGPLFRFRAKFLKQWVFSDRKYWPQKEANHILGSIFKKRSENFSRLRYKIVHIQL